MTENSNIAQNLRDQRNHHGYTLEQVAEKVHVSRQAIAKWESGESAPDISHADLLANLYGITLDNLIHYSIESNKVGIPPKGKSLYGTVTVGERGQIVIPKKARDVFGFNKGTSLVVLGDTTGELPGIALVKSDTFLDRARAYSDVASQPKADDHDK
ncbi:helix-turn-helix domain-containing protein [Lentilactobacillus kefiri]|uniref:HTH cro/C1-type domain-containing protein n=2 Tax=Lentilactobacillus kefiri TaxID=33962 RepID=A0A8E1RKU7_LENKE|nr:helix-turn-helix domain-containing protein [Lentilactobacillus kefiri]KRL70161.1 hypothetical protein FD08_GL001397 [Lentilactobacillus parakefiri DSM 10551]KRM54121.1 hypothetical protein FC95_GL001829 [Lentilactobacillus kefiri DSM 20587 = JCM 5818]MCJ2160969.1 helix-turn-helix domain-containing protein [Lentilactobacillus kefiri]MCP9368897.1 helix-turn-helix domain-containing protein [Lentilactobacillus kefiri]MDH5108362.1 helix-turn-helix domain-containing protein [Lentilactobacillus ke